MGDETCTAPGSGHGKDDSASTAPPRAGRPQISGGSSAPPELGTLAQDVAGLLLEHARRCLDEGRDVLAVRSSDMRAELLSLGYQQGAVSEQTVRGALRAVISLARLRA
jgi:hypothetical protein